MSGDDISATNDDTSSSPAGNIIKHLRIGLAVGGAVAVLVGLLMLIWPAKTAVVFTVVLAVYALLAGVVYVYIGITARTLSGWARAAQIVTGAVFAVAAIIAFANPAASTASFALIVVIFIGVSWIMEGIASLATLGTTTSKGLTVVFGIVGILGGVALIIAPLTGAVLMWAWLSVTLIVIGVVQIVRAIRA